MRAPTNFHTIFQQPWWLEAAAPGRWDAVSIETGGELQAWLPFTIRETHGIKTLGMPALTQSLGPWVRSTEAGYSKTLGRQISLYRSLIEALPPHDRFIQSFAPQVTNWLPFYWAGFTQTTRYTYTFDLTKSQEELWRALDKRNRRQLRKASGRIVAEASDDLDVFLRLNRATFERQGLDMPYSDDYVHRLDEAAKRNAKRWIVIARDEGTGEAHAGIYMVSDGKRAYSLMSGADPKFRDLNGGIVARWKAIELVRSAGVPLLDLQGSMMENVERRNRNYGTTQVPYFALYRSNGRAETQYRRQRRLKAPLIVAWRAKEALKKLW